MFLSISLQIDSQLEKSFGYWAIPLLHEWRNSRSCLPHMNGQHTLFNQLHETCIACKWRDDFRMEDILRKHNNIKIDAMMGRFRQGCEWWKVDIGEAKVWVDRDSNSYMLERGNSFEDFACCEDGINAVIRTEGAVELRYMQTNSEVLEVRKGRELDRWHSGLI